MNSLRWIGVDLDGTLATIDRWRGPEHIGEPVPAMVQRVKEWLAQGVEVRIFTARVCGGQSEGDALKSTAAIDAWCKRHFGQILPVTATKDYRMRELWDDRAVRVEANTGRVLSS